MWNMEETAGVRSVIVNLKSADLAWEALYDTGTGFLTRVKSELNFFSLCGDKSDYVYPTVFQIGI